MISPTGIWSEEEQGAHIFSYRVAKWIADNVDGQFFDFGAGDATLKTYLFDRRINCIAIDGFANKGIDYCFDLSKRMDIPFKRNVISIEVFEHIPKQFEAVFVDNIARHCEGKLIISVAHEGQQGTGHVNCRPDWYVKQIFEAKGFKYMDEQTKEIRSCAEGFVAYLRENLFVFEI